MTGRPKVVVLGGGMAGLAAAWELSAPGWEERFDRITVVQRGWRLGGKGASSRGINGRIEEHGLHVWLGYYHNAFRLVRAAYDVLDRPSTDPTAAVTTFDDAFVPAPVVGLEDRQGGDWEHWVAEFSGTERRPGTDDAPATPLTPVTFVQRALRLLADFAASNDPGAPDPAGRQTTATTAAATTAGVILRLLDAAIPAVERLALSPAIDATGLVTMVERWRRSLATDAMTRAPDRRTWHLVDLVTTTIVGLAADGLLVPGGRLSDINHLDYREWMRLHGAAEETLDSPLVRGVYNLVFGFVDGDPDRPAFAADLGIYLSARLFLDYEGAIFWKMTAGMGDVVVAPLYQALRQRGVRFELFHDLRALRLDPTGRVVDRLEIDRQVALAPGVDEYDPLVRVGDLPCWPDRPDRDQLADAHRDEPLGRAELESAWTDRAPAERLVWERGRHFDQLVFALPVATLPHVAADLLAHRPAWRDMADHLATVATRSLQLWTGPDQTALGWRWPGATVSGYVDDFDTFSAMDHLLAREPWPGPDRPRGLGYFCSTMRSADIVADPTAATIADLDDEVRRTGLRFIEEHLGHLWPGAVDGDGRFRWEVLTAPPDVVGADRLASQYWRSNAEPSERYVQSLPGTDRFRLRADRSGFTNLYLAGDWIDSGLNAGCIEAAVMSGKQAANALLGRPLRHGVSGLHLPDR